MTVHGVAVPYRDCGSGDPVLLIAGAGASSSTWQAQIDALTAVGYRVVAIEHRGFGGSPVGNPYKLADLAGDVGGVIEELDLQPCRIIGMSLGALVAQELASKRPELVHSLVLMATWARTGYFRATLARATARQLQSGAEIDPEYVAAQLAVQMFSPCTLADDDQIRDWLDLFTTLRVAGDSLAAQNEATIDVDQRAQLRDIASPTLVVAFADDVLCPPSVVREVADAVPGSRFVQIEQCGHLGVLERPDAVNDVLVNFFAR
ncbi:MAG: alpha/beta fold hydrolase [Pseudonocardiales bacterium]|nr:alpha/beta fold hydrolase [Pseudonocardiales bacterium]